MYGKARSERSLASGPTLIAPFAAAASSNTSRAAGAAPTLCGRDAVQINERERPIDLAELQATLEPLGTVRANDYALRFICPPHEMTIFADGRAIVKGTDDIGVARGLYARYVGI